MYSIVYLHIAGVYWSKPASEFSNCFHHSRSIDIIVNQVDTYIRDEAIMPA